ncbi:MAG: PACE efflux transporter [Oxalobacteraceae bacterium]|nr:MAG: PACE efflux transporter [Oxalobacteraceae bacterium]
MQGIKRKLLYVTVFETVAIAICTVGFALHSGKSLAHAGALSVATSAIAVLWNFLFTSLFEAWEARQAKGGRSVGRRVAHAVLFEAGLLMVLVPLTAAWLEISLPAALGLNVGLAGFFLVYTFVFNWSFDRLFGLPASARK